MQQWHPIFLVSSVLLWVFANEIGGSVYSFFVITFSGYAVLTLFLFFFLVFWTTSKFTSRRMTVFLMAFSSLVGWIFRFHQIVLSYLKQYKALSLVIDYWYFIPLLGGLFGVLYHWKTDLSDTDKSRFRFLLRTISLILFFFAFSSSFYTMLCLFWIILTQFTFIGRFTNYFIEKFKWRTRKLYWKIFGKPAKRMLTMEEYKKESEEATTRGLIELRNLYANNPSLLSRFDEQGLRRIETFIEKGPSAFILSQMKQNSSQLRKQYTNQNYQSLYPSVESYTLVPTIEDDEEFQIEED